jgi:hypothetical protein
MRRELEKLACFVGIGIALGGPSTVGAEAPTPPPGTPAAPAAPSPTSAPPGPIAGDEGERRDGAPTPPVSGRAFRARVIERGTRRNLADVNVYVLPHKLQGRTDGTGEVQFESISEGPFRWIVNLPGYERFELDDDGATPEAPRQLRVTKRNYEVYETTVTDRDANRDARTRSLRPSEFLKAPGAYGDPIKAVQNMPGVGRVAGLSSQVIIEGSAPNDTSYLIDGHQVPIIFHFGGLTSVVFPEAVERVDYMASGFGPEYGRVTGGLVGVTTRAGRDDRFHLLSFVDTFQAGALAEGSLGDGRGTWLVGVRQSYVGSVLKAVVPQSANFDLSVAPKYTDALVVWESKASTKTRVKIVGVGSYDEVRFLFDAPIGRGASGRGTFSNRTSFWRVIPQLTYRPDEWAEWKFSLGLGQDRIRVDVYDDFFDVTALQLTTRGEYDRKFSELYRGSVGFDHQYSWANVGYRLPGTAPGASSSTSVPIESEVAPEFKLLGVYWRNVFTFGDWNVEPKLRVEKHLPVDEAFVLPRLALGYRWSDSLKLRAATGLYAQPPLPQELDDRLGNPALSSSRAWHGTVGFEKDFREGSSRGFFLSADFFYKDLSRLVVPSPQTQLVGGQIQPLRFDNSGLGRAYGIASQLRYDGDRLKGWIAYTLSRSERSDPYRGNEPFRFDQTHILNAMATYDLGDRWTVGARIRLISGQRFTPVVDAVYDSDDDVFRPIPGARNSSRLPAFWSLDLRFDKQWVFDGWLLSLYLDIQNATNNRNVEGVRYSYDFAVSETVASLPIFPVFGLKAEF